MATLFSRIIDGELPSKTIYADETVVAFLTISPLTPGHTLVVSREEVDQWTDASEPLLHHCMDVARRIGNAAKQAFDAPRAGLIIAGLEIPHLHVHVFPVWELGDFSFSRAQPATEEDLEQAASRLRAALG
jgi:diadenosine tetraphosphate (Ap4A) HIT family hydrolase